jgi:hypothetical protein
MKMFYCTRFFIQFPTNVLAHCCMAVYRFPTVKINDKQKNAKRIKALRQKRVPFDSLQTVILTVWKNKIK